MHAALVPHRRMTVMASPVCRRSWSKYKENARAHREWHRQQEALYQEHDIPTLRQKASLLGVDAKLSPELQDALARVQAALPPLPHLSVIEPFAQLSSLHKQGAPLAHLPVPGRAPPRVDRRHDLRA